MSKWDYVKAQTQSRDHRCHWTGCERQVPPALWGCKEHWMMLPKNLRNKIWATYVPGQEKTMTPSEAYLEAADEVQDWIRENGARLEQEKAEKAGQLSLFQTRQGDK